MSSAPVDSVSARAAWWLAGLLAMASIWGHWQVVGTHDPNAANQLHEVSTWSVAGRWPYLVAAPDGLHLQATGLVIGLLSSSVVLWIVWRRSFRRRAGS
ncbi:MAG: hypothetical protein MUC36_04295 [Planctomycetes bacterium]|jgi:hypothetical protein|nr:hypothetical protein [Planctomycetota bacterium]